MPVLIRVKQIENSELGAFVTGILTSTTGYFYANTVQLTSGILYQDISYGVTYPAAPKVQFSINHRSGIANISANVLVKGTSSANFEFSNFVPSTGYFVDIITTQ